MSFPARRPIVSKRIPLDDDYEDDGFVLKDENEDDLSSLPELKRLRKIMAKKRLKVIDDDEGIDDVRETRFDELEREERMSRKLAKLEDKRELELEIKHKKDKERRKKEFKERKVKK